MEESGHQDHLFEPIKIFKEKEVFIHGILDGRARHQFVLKA